MAVYLVTWDLNRKRSNYDQARQELVSHLQRYQHVRDQGLDSVWFLQSSSDANAVSADIRLKMDSDDKLIVTKMVSGQHQGWLHKDVWSWINARL